jgi:hypothetical protein
VDAGNGFLFFFRNITGNIRYLLEFDVITIEGRLNNINITENVLQIVIHLVLIFYLIKRRIDAVSMGIVNKNHLQNQRCNDEKSYVSIEDVKIKKNNKHHQNFGDKDGEC